LPYTRISIVVTKFSIILPTSNSVDFAIDVRETEIRRTS